MKLVLTMTAKEDLRSIRKTIAEHSPTAAARVATTIRAKLKLLRTQPKMGRPIEERDAVRELVVDEDYVIPYLLTDEAIVVLRVWHARQDRSRP